MVSIHKQRQILFWGNLFEVYRSGGPRSLPLGTLIPRGPEPSELTLEYISRPAGRIIGEGRMKAGLDNGQPTFTYEK